MVLTLNYEVGGFQCGVGSCTTLTSYSVLNIIFTRSDRQTIWKTNNLKDLVLCSFKYCLVTRFQCPGGPGLLKQSKHMHLRDRRL